MKLTHKLVFLISVTIAGCTGRNDITIRGTVKSGEGTGLILQQLEANRITDLDSTKLSKKSEFRFRVRLENPELLILRNEKGGIINLLPFPGENIRVTANYPGFSSDYNIEGSPESERIQQLVMHLAATRKKMDSIADIMNTLPGSEIQKLEILQNAYQQSFINQKRYNIRFIIENTTSLSSIYALYQKLYDDMYILNEFTDLQYYKYVADSMKVYYPNSSLTLSLVEDIELREQQFEERMRLESLLASAEEKSIIDVALPDMVGDTIKVSDLKERVVMIIFWSSGNSASVQGLLALQNVYKKYHDKGFEVYAISLDNDKSRWVSSVNFNQFEWINVSELSYPDSEVDKIYNITKIPTGFLINRDGEIVARDIFGRTLEIWLDNLL